MTQIFKSGQGIFLNFLLSLTFQAFVMFVLFLPIQSNLYLVLARGKGPKNSIHKKFFKTKLPRPQLDFTCLTVHG